MVVTNKYEITAYDSAIYVIDPLAILVDSMAYPTKKLTLKVLVADIDTLGKSEEEWSRITPYKRQMEPPFSWEGDHWMQMILLAFAVVVLTLALLYVAVRLKDNKPIIRRIRRKKPQTPHQEAMGKIEEIRHETTQTEDPKTYYTRLTDILRQYIRRRYGFNAMEMTSAEIISKMEEMDDGTGWNDLQQLFTTADLVKFAKYSPLINENDQNLLNAIDFINRTKKVEAEGTQETEVVVVDQQSRKRRTLLVTGIAVVSLLLLATVAYLAYRIVTMHLL